MESTNPETRTNSRYLGLMRASSVPCLKCKVNYNATYFSAASTTRRGPVSFPSESPFLEATAIQKVSANGNNANCSTFSINFITFAMPSILEVPLNVRGMQNRTGYASALLRSLPNISSCFLNPTLVDFQERTAHGTSTSSNILTPSTSRSFVLFTKSSNITTSSIAQTSNHTGWKIGFIAPPMTVVLLLLLVLLAWYIRKLLWRRHANIRKRAGNTGAGPHMHLKPELDANQIRAELGVSEAKYELEGESSRFEIGHGNHQEWAQTALRELRGIEPT